MTYFDIHSRRQGENIYFRPNLLWRLGLSSFDSKISWLDIFCLTKWKYLVVVENNGSL